MRRTLALLLAMSLSPSLVAAQPRRRSPRPPARATSIRYRVVAGDTCASIAQRFYRDVRRTHLIHESNPSLGRPPHRLRPGSELQLPRIAPRRTEPDAVLTRTQNTVEIGAPAARRARGLDPLFRGTTVSTGSASTAELTFADESQLRMSEQTTVVILGETNTRVRRLAGAGDTTLVRGTLRAFLDDLSAQPPAPAPSAAPTPGRAVARRPARRVVRRPPRPIAIRTQRGRVVLGSGEASLSAAEGGAVTLSVYRGQSRIQSGARSMLVREGFAVRAEQGRPMSQHRLPVAPQWTSAPPRLLFTEGERARFEAAWRVGDTPRGAPPPPAHEWHFQVARDPSFLSIAVDTHLAPTTLQASIPELRPGRYFVRVSAVDAERFEGPFAPTVAVRVVNPRAVPTAVPYESLVVLGAGLRCGLDGAPLSPISGALRVERRAPHTLRCALADHDEPLVTRELPALRRAPMTLVTRLVVPDERLREGHVRLHVIDHEGVDIPSSSLRVRASEGVVAAATLREAEPAEPGVWLLPVRWREGLRTMELTVEVEGADPLRSEALPLPTPPRPPERSNPFSRRLFARGDLLLGSMLSAYQRNGAAMNFSGNAPGIGVGFGASLRAGIDFVRPRPGLRGPSVGANVAVTTMLYPSSLDSVAVATQYGAGLHVGMELGRLALWTDLNAGVVLTGPVLRFGLDLGLGLDVRLTRALSIGPTIRYLHVVQPDDDPFPEDARTLAGGVALTLRAE